MTTNETDIAVIKKIDAETQVLLSQARLNDVLAQEAEARIAHITARVNVDA